MPELRDPGSVRPSSSLPAWFIEPDNKLEQLIRYGCNVYGLFSRLSKIKDERRRPQVPTEEVVRALFFMTLLRVPSLNALEGELKKPGLQRLLGRRTQLHQKAFSADTVARVLDGLDVSSSRNALHQIILTAERNKVFRDGLNGARRPVALDAWETFSSYDRHCEHCLQRQVRFKGERKVTQYYHRFVVALMLGSDAEVVLDFEPLRTADLRRESGTATEKHDGEQTAALRLIDRIHETFGTFVDLFVLDALYPNGPMMSRIVEHGYGAIITLKKETDEPLKDALLLMRDRPPDSVWDDPVKKEHIEAWDINTIETLDSFKGRVRVLRAVVSRPDETTGTWCAAVIGDRTRTLPARVVHRLHRSRWHIENTAFNQWTQQWHLTHVYRHKPNALLALLMIGCLSFNLLQLFVYRRLRRPRTPTDPCDTIRSLVTEIRDAVTALRRAVPWRTLFDPANTS